MCCSQEGVASYEVELQPRGVVAESGVLLLEGIALCEVELQLRVMCCI